MKIFKKGKQVLLGGVMAVSLGAGHYQFVGGLTDTALGVEGQYKVDSLAMQTITYVDHNQFKTSLEETFKTAEKLNQDLRRLDFTCKDGSKEFTVYFNPLGIVGIPDKDIICDDGGILLHYTADKG